MDELEYEINQFITQKKNQIRGLHIISGIFAIIFIIAFLKQFGNSFSLYVFIPAFIAIVIIIVAIKLKEGLIKEIKPKVMSAVLPAIFDDMNVIYAPNGVSRAEFNQSGMYSGYTEFYSADGIKSFDNNFYIGNVIASKKQNEQKSICFSGIWGYAQTSEYQRDEILIKPSYENKYVTNIVESQNKMLNLTPNKLHFENNQFNTMFEVYAKDQIKAREIVTLTYMEKLIQIRNEINAPVKILYKGNRKYIAIWNHRIVSEKDWYKNGFKFQNVKYELEKIYKIYKEL